MMGLIWRQGYTRAEDYLGTYIATMWFREPASTVLAVCAECSSSIRTCCSSSTGDATALVQHCIQLLSVWSFPKVLIPGYLGDSAKLFRMSCHFPRTQLQFTCC